MGLIEQIKETPRTNDVKFNDYGLTRVVLDGTTIWYKAEISTTDTNLLNYTYSSIADFSNTSHYTKSINGKKYLAAKNNGNSNIGGGAGLSTTFSVKLPKGTKTISASGNIHNGFQNISNFPRPTLTIKDKTANKTLKSATGSVDGPFYASVSISYQLSEDISIDHDIYIELYVSASAYCDTWGASVTGGFSTLNVTYY